MKKSDNTTQYALTEAIGFCLSASVFALSEVSTMIFESKTLAGIAVLFVYGYINIIGYGLLFSVVATLVSWLILRLMKARSDKDFTYLLSSVVIKFAFCTLGVYAVQSAVVIGLSLFGFSMDKYLVFAVSAGMFLLSFTFVGGKGKEIGVSILCGLLILLIGAPMVVLGVKVGWAISAALTGVGRTFVVKVTETNKIARQRAQIDKNA